MVINVTCPTHKEAINETGEKWVDSLNLSKVEKELEKNFEVVKVENIIASFYELEEMSNSANRLGSWVASQIGPTPVLDER